MKTDFKKITLTIDRARGSTTEYEIAKTDTGFIATEYIGTWKYSGLAREEYQTCQGIGTEREYVKLAEFLHKIKIERLDGYHKSNRFALDGESFSLEIILATGKSVKAYGCNTYPKHYKELLEYIEEAACGPKEY